VNPWSDIAGAANAQATIAHSMAANRVAHAYLLTGGNPDSRAAVIRAVACALNCESPTALEHPGDACGSCDSCRKILTNIHPDMVVLMPTGASAQVAIETVRDMTIRLGLLPNEAKVRVVIIHEAVGLAGPAANALLKTLEEPPARTMFILATSAPDQLLPTIRSRCQRLRMTADGTVVADTTANTNQILAEKIIAYCNKTDSVHEVGIAAAVVEEKGAHLQIVSTLSIAFAQHATQAARDGAWQHARINAQRAMVAQHWHFAMRVHNAHPLLATEAMLSELRELT
jgi:DNA polymerase III delta prime subunit